MPPALEPSTDTANTGPTRDITILLAEDEQRARQAIAKTLRRHDFHVIEAENGHRALALAEQTPPDMAIVDLDLPGVDGYGVIEALKSAHGTTLPCLVVSGNFEANRRMRAFDVGADDFIAKPVHMPELVERVKAFHRKLAAYTEEHRARERAERMNLYAAEASALLAHDLNNGLAAAIGNLQFVEEMVKLSGEPALALAATHRAMRRMSGLVKNFVDISRLEEDALIPKRSVANLQEILQSTASIHEAALHATEAHILVDCPADLEWNIDAALVERVIHNLVGNATRYVKKNGTICLRGARVPSLAGEDQLRIVVENDGPSVPEAFAKVMFEKYRAGGGGKSMRGMGLYFCRLACEAHGGTIALSHDFAGTRFVILLPPGG